MALPTRPKSFFSSTSFARQQLERHGWKTGSGLGKTESGMVDPIKVKIKHDKTGVGHDLGEQFTYHWWDHVFNNAAKNISVETDEQDEVRVKQRGDNAKLISNKKLSKQSLKPLLYGNFVKTATLTEDGEHHEDKNSSSEDEDDDKDAVSHEERDKAFFKACGGRTAHKGARHGLKSSAKLKRIQEQEAVFMRGSGGLKERQTASNDDDDDDLSKSIEHDAERTGSPSKKRKKKRKKSGKDEDVITVIKTEGNICKKHKKKDKTHQEDKPAEINKSDSMYRSGGTNVCKKHKKQDKQKKLQTVQSRSGEENLASINVPIVGRTMCETEMENEGSEMRMGFGFKVKEDAVEDVTTPKKKKKKSKRRKSEQV